MEKKYIIGGLAIVGAIALFAYLKPTSAKRNSDGFFGANGGSLTGKARSTCKLCKDSETGSTYQNWNGICDTGDSCVKRVAISQQNY
jgi:hypothetical protein